MGERHQFRAVIEDAGGGGAYVTIPFDAEQVFGKKRVPIQATIDGEFYRGTLVRMGGPCHLLLILKEIRARIGKSFGDEVEIVLEEDSELREVAVPADLQAALDENPAAQAFFDQLAYTHRKEYARWIEEAKREETRRGRVERAVEMLLAGKRGR